MTSHFFFFCMFFTYSSNISKSFAPLTSTLSSILLTTNAWCPNPNCLVWPTIDHFILLNLFDSVLNQVLVLVFPFREAMKVNGQMDCHPSAQGATLSPSRHSNVKKVTGVGGTTYEISVWAGTPHPPATTTTTLLQRDSPLSVIFVKSR